MTRIIKLAVFGYGFWSNKYNVYFHWRVSAVTLRTDGNSSTYKLSCHQQQGQTNVSQLVLVRKCSKKTMLMDA